MADAFGDDLFNVFEEQGDAESTKTDDNDQEKESLKPFKTDEQR